MFGFQFYPTPERIAQKMVEALQLQDGMNVLEPSAGKGDLVLAAKRNAAVTVKYCEIDPHLALLADAVADEFLKSNCLELTREDLYGIDAVIMNPPFRHARKHILHLWHILPAGATMVALRGFSERNQSETRVQDEKELQALISNYGSIENVGNCFVDAERKTAVEVELIYLQKQEGSKMDYEGMEDLFDMEDYELPSDDSGFPMRYDAIFEIVSQYRSAVLAYGDLFDQAQIVNSYASAFSKTRINVILQEGDKRKSMETYKVELQKEAWKKIFDRMNMRQFVTSKLNEEINQFITQQSEVPFTMKNVYIMLDLIVQTHGQRMNRVYEEVFDRLTRHYHNNRWNVPGWKTNDSYLVGKKFIFDGVFSDKYSSGGYVDTAFYGDYSRSVINDLIMVLDHLTGWTAPRATEEEIRLNYGKNPYARPHDLVNSWTYSEKQAGVSSYKNKNWGQWYDFYGYFEAKAFKKGTIHLKWKDLDLWARFNQRICEIKGFVLPEQVRKG